MEMFDNHMLSLYKECPTKFYYRIVKGITIQGSKGALTFGQAIHAALDERAKGMSVDTAVTRFKEIVPADLDDKRTVRVGEAMIRGYYDQYKEDPISEYLGVEQVVKLPLGDFTYVMRMDKVCKLNGMLWIMDHKTTSRISDNLIHMANPNDAFTGYIWGATKIFQDQMVYGLIMDVLELPYQYKPKKGEAIGRLEPKYLRTTTSRTSEELAHWEKRRIQLMQEVSAAAKDSLHLWEMNTGSCTNYNSRCEFHSLCLQGMPCQEVEVSDNYITSPWEPWNEEVN